MSFKLLGTVTNPIRSDKELKRIIVSTADSAFVSNMKHLDDFMEERHFVKYRTTTYVRRNSVDVLEFVELQQDKYGSKTVTVNYALMPLYVRHPFISFDLGGRLGQLICGKDVWWDYSDDRVAEISFRNIMQAFDEVLLPWFSDHATNNVLKAELNNKKIEYESAGGALSPNQTLWLYALDAKNDYSEIISENIRVHQLFC